MNIKFIEHKKTSCPTNKDNWVIYKTINHQNIIHTHLPMVAAELNWSHKPSLNNKIHSYAVVKKPNFPKFDYLWTSEERKQIDYINQSEKSRAANL